MDITWLGGRCLELKNNSATVLMDPLGVDGTFTADIVTLSQITALAPAVEAENGELKILDGPGEYEVKDIFITAVATYPSSGEAAARNIVFVFQTEGLQICHLGALQEILNAETLELLGNIDVLLLPVGAGGLNSTTASDIIARLEPPIVVPINYSGAGQVDDLNALDHFIKEMGLSQVDPISKLRVSQGALPLETQIVVLSPQ